MERERCSELYFYRPASLQTDRLHLAKPICGLKIREREVRTRLPCRILRLVVDLAWGTWQHPTLAPKEPGSLASLGMTILSGGPHSGQRECHDVLS